MAPSGVIRKMSCAGAQARKTPSQSSGPNRSCRVQFAMQDMGKSHRNFGGKIRRRCDPSGPDPIGNTTARHPGQDRNPQPDGPPHPHFAGRPKSTLPELARGRADRSHGAP